MRDGEVVTEGKAVYEKLRREKKEKREKRKK